MKKLLLLLTFMLLASVHCYGMYRPPDIRLAMKDEPSTRNNKLDTCVQAGIQCCGKLMFQEPLDKNEQGLVSRCQVAGAVGWGLGAAWLSCSGPAIGLAAGAGFVHGRLSALIGGACQECWDGKEKEE